VITSRVISYYNVLLFRELIRLLDIRSLGIVMVGVGWGAASVASLVALEHQLWLAVLALGAFSFLYVIGTRPDRLR